MTFGENLKTLRISRSISQKELATELGFSFQNISKWERNESLPDIETLIEISKYFGTSTDALLGVSSEIKFSTLEIDKSEVAIYQTYPETETSVSGKLLFAIDSESKITGTVFIPYMRTYRTGYTRNGYEPLTEQSTLVYEYRYNFHCENIVDNKRIKIPENGFLIAVSDETFAAKKMMKFITPEEYDAFLDPDTHPGYYNSRNGKSLFGEILKQNELDDITVKLTDTGILFQKRLDTVDPMLVNIETLTKIVRKELQKEHEKQIRQLMDKIDDLEDRIDELEDMIGDNESNIEDLDGRINEIEVRFSEKDT
ncbi:MAG: helix-turn-helix domain-containing protein [Clostridia bacterium]|nr:helix-turn-helix domain-containing protein [Clostridia bacterium]